MKEGGRFQFQGRIDQTKSEPSPGAYRWSKMSRRRIISPGLIQEQVKTEHEKGHDQH